MKPVRNLICIFSVLAFTCGEVERQNCAARKYNENSVICVCNSTYCDNIGTIKAPEPGHCLHFESNTAGLRLESQPCNVSKAKESSGLHNSKVTVNPSQTYQEILGFGGAITDSVGINLASLSSPTQNTLLSQYFGPEGIGYSFIRMPMGGSDFSTKFYTYDDVPNDTTLSHFNLTYEDYLYKIPFVKKATALSPRPIRLLIANWQIPTWMKEGRLVRELLIISKLKEKYYQLLADYMVRFLDSYKKEGLEFWSLSAQNEPVSGFFFLGVPSALSWTVNEQAQFMTKNLIPTLKSHGYEGLKLTLLEDTRPFVNIWLDELKKYPEIMERAACLGVHWYLDPFFSPDIYSDVKKQFPNLPIISTEASNFRLTLTTVRLGSWENAERYASDIIQDLNAGVAAWIDWNIALDLKGGPSYLRNYLDSPILVNASADEFYKQPMFYVMTHFSKFVPPGSIRVNLKIDDKVVEGIAFLTPEKTVVVVLTNRNTDPKEVQLQVAKIGTTDITLSPQSINTLIFNNNT